jgi:hypothetical protein
MSLIPKERSSRYITVKQLPIHCARLVVVGMLALSLWTSALCQQQAGRLQCRVERWGVRFCSVERPSEHGR